MKKIILLLLLLVASAFSATRIAATDGNDTNPGSLESSLATAIKAINLSGPGDAILVRGGLFAQTATISIRKSGHAQNKYYLPAFPQERPVFDFSNQPLGQRGFSLKADHWLIQGLEIKGAGNNGMEISRESYNRIERCSFYENRDTGLQLSNGAAFNEIINCDSYYNADPPDYGDADGFASMLTMGTGNYFFGCRAWVNSDDGWDGYLRGATDITTTLEQCWSRGNGYLTDGTDPGTQANGNGFKMGGGDNSNRDQLMHHFILKRCLAFDNKAKGFDQNNSWMAPFHVTSEDFVSLDPAWTRSPRRDDGRLPEIPFLRLADGSDLIDAGAVIDSAFFGTAPDLGAFETSNNSHAGKVNETPGGFHLAQNHPNPFNPSTVIRYHLAASCRTSLKIFDATGREIAVLVDSEKPAGEHWVTWHAGSLSAGVYWYRLQAGAFVQIKKNDPGEI
ncbi:MAG TPA: right-handed parallel beta-helix repeat-containing protein [bacterium]|nr:right-handed parallel beta-helix repeat-containing protein [bacterium]HPN35268.1 right-handed parallel beta-helix repeat-containing protein [bacterium]